jgi:hypothetical protein
MFPAAFLTYALIAGATDVSVAAEADAGSLTSLEALQVRLSATEEKLAAQEADLAALSARELEATKGDSPLRAWGFLDVGASKIFAPSTSSITNIVPSTASTFVLGNVNLYLEAKPIEHFSAFVETRLTNLPDGAMDINGNMSSTYTWDYAAGSGPAATTRLGSIVLERAYLQWEHSDALSIRAGEFLNPFGIWNIDHGSPTLIPLMLPQFESIELFPTHLVGLEALGTTRLGEWEAGYYLYLANGRNLGQLSMTEDNKMVGGRVYARTLRPLRMTYGLSGFIDRFNSTTVNSDGDFSWGGLLNTAFHERGVGADASIDVGPVRLRTEFTLRNIVYDPGLHPTPGFGGIYYPNRNDIDWYVLAAYQLPWYGIEPYVFAEAFRGSFPYGTVMMIPSAGVNIHINAAAQLKLQYAARYWVEDVFSLAQQPEGVAQDISFVSARFVLAF